jgi:tRNA threonylcarbamoyladenosine biosynthesis protein TsaE
MSEIIVSGVDDLPNAAKEFIKLLDDNRIIAFYGEMGAGKTTFIKSICEILGVEDEVNSPTFTIVNEYKSDKFPNIYHFDLYRIGSKAEIYDIGFSEYMNYGDLIFIEWSEKLEDELPENCLKVYIEETDNNNRKIKWESIKNHSHS